MSNNPYIDQMKLPSSKPARRRKIVTKSDKKIADDEFMAAAIGDVEWLRQSLRDARGKINYDKNGLSPIHLASIHGRLACLKYLVEKAKINVNLPSQTGWRPLHLSISNATGKRSFNCLLYLLEKGADASVANEDGITPAHQAASEGHVQCLKAIIEVGGNITGQDRREHTPLDLAKLWGNRKCARILAAEVWHQEKDFLAVEMKQLKRVKMQQVLQELADHETHQAEQQFYGNNAFNNWLQEKGLDKEADQKKEAQRFKKSILKQPSSRKGGKSSTLSGETGRESTFKANSVSRTDVQSRGASSNVQVSYKQPAQTSVVQRRISEVSHRPPSRQTGSSETDFGLHETTEVRKDDADKVIGNAKKGPAFMNPNRWEITTHVPGKKYEPLLKDVYPRDQYTMKPTHRSTPPEQELLQKSNSDVPQIVLIDDKSNIRSLRWPKLPQDVIDKNLSKNPEAFERPQVFKCKNIIDIEQKKKLPFEKRFRDEATIHLCDDIDSPLFRNSLQKPLGSTSVSTSTSSVSDWRDEDFPTDKVIEMLKRMAKPDRFPKTLGSDFEVNFGKHTVC